MNPNLRADSARMLPPTPSTLQAQRISGSLGASASICSLKTEKQSILFGKDSWLLEAVSMLTSLVCQGAIIAILSTMQNKPLANWTAPISLNTTIAILTTASKSLLLLAVAECISQSKWNHFRKPRQVLDFDIFDNASRGPLGAVQILTKSWTLATLASVGATITLLSLTLDPFAQQVLSFQQRDVSMGPKTASFALSYGYDTIGPTFQGE